MKKIIYFLLLGFASLNIVLPVMASEIKEETTAMAQEVKGYINENEEYVAPIIYGEIKEGTFVRTFEDELLTIPDAEIIGFETRKQEKEKLINAWKISETSFTEEMKRSGYIWYSENSVIQKEADLAGECGESDNFIKRDDITTEVKSDQDGNPVVLIGKGYVTFAATVQSDIHEVCYVQIVSNNSFKIYEFELYEYNNYSTSVQLPAGSYSVSGGGISKDYTSSYPISKTTFKVTEGAATIVPLTIGTINKAKMEKGITITTEEVKETEEEENTQHIEKNKTNTLKGFFVRIIFLVVILIAGVVFYIKKNGIKGQ